MGNAFSKKQTLRDRLIALENEVLKQEYELNEIMNSGALYSTFWLSLFVFPIVSYISYTLELHLISCLFFAFLFLTLWYFVCEMILSKRKEIKHKKVARLREERKNLIEKCKNDVNFSITKSLIDKYENEEDRNTFFNQIIKKKRSNIDSVSDFVLGNDPANLNALICTHCGVHNGLVDPKNNNFTMYYCFNCKHKNIRKQTVTSPTTSSTTIDNTETK